MISQLLRPPLPQLWQPSCRILRRKLVCPSFAVPEEGRCAVTIYQENRPGRSKISCNRCLATWGRLKRRMAYKGFPPDDSLLVAVCRVEDAMHALSVEVHYLSCDGGVGRKREEQPGGSREPPGTGLLSKLTCCALGNAGVLQEEKTCVHYLYRYPPNKVKIQYPPRREIRRGKKLAPAGASA
jgi:hypothetical protein